jgi:hypothetical protein
MASRKAWQTGRAVARRAALAMTQYREWSSIPVTIFTSRPPTRNVVANLVTAVGQPGRTLVPVAAQPGMHALPVDSISLCYLGHRDPALTSRTARYLCSVTLTLIDKNLRNSDKAWAGNDLRDADAMSAAIPYCDIVPTDKHVAAQLARSPAVSKHGTVVLARLRDLNDRLPA